MNTLLGFIIQRPKAKRHHRLSPFFLTLLSFLPLLLSTPSVIHAQWEPDRRLTFNDSASYTSVNNARCIAASGDTVHVVWHDHRDGNWEIYSKRSTDAGTTWGQDTRLTIDSASSKNPSIAVAGSTVHLSWQDYRDGNWEIYYKRSTDGGTTWGLDTRLSADPGQSSGPSIAVSDSVVHLVWFTNPDSSTAKIFYKRSSDGGMTWSPDTCLRVQARSQGVIYTACISSAGREIHLVYEGGWGNIDYMRSLDGGSTWYGDTILLRAYGDMNQSTIYGQPSLITLGSRIHMCCWYDHTTRQVTGNQCIYYMTSANGGTGWSGPVVIVDGSYLWITVRSPSIDASSSNVHVAWYDNRINNYEIFYRNSLDWGTTWQPETRLTNDSLNSINPFIAVQGSKVHVVWADNRDGNYEIYYKRNLTGNGVEAREKSITNTTLRQLKVIPNPFLTFTTLPGHEAEQFLLYDISGRRVGTCKGDRVGEGLAPGVYFLKSEGKDAKPLRIVKLR